MELPELAVSRFNQGYSCSQAVFSVLAERHGVPAELSYRIAACFGGGMARSGQTCGCVTGALMGLGLDQAATEPQENAALKEAARAAGEQFIRNFTARHGSTICRDLLGCDLGAPEGRQQARNAKLFETRCAQYVQDAVMAALSAK